VIVTHVLLRWMKIPWSHTQKRICWVLMDVAFFETKESDVQFLGTRTLAPLPVSDELINMI
jgi:hypothetical protein